MTRVIQPVLLMHYCSETIKKRRRKNMVWHRLTYYFTEMNGPGCF